MALVLCAGGLSAPRAQADGNWYALDPVHTRVAFSIRHAGLSDAIGTVSGSTGTVYFDPDDWTRTRIDVSVPITRLDLGDSAWTDATLAANLLDGARHPLARFVSERVEPLSDRRARVHGTLTLRGVSRPLVLDAVLNADKRHPLPPFRRTLGVSAAATLSRADFGIDAWPSVIGDAVALRLEVEATRSRAAPQPSAGDTKAVPDAGAGPATPAAPDAGDEPATPAASAARPVESTP
ncbi:MAG TPA: YceI family protein [Luteimonas sp.]|nr:YceI family protein [Luteimonas sp.]